MESCVICTCGEGVKGEWEACKNVDCPIEWFHSKCVGVLYHMEGEWVCPQCLLEPDAESEDGDVSPRQDSSVAVLPKPNNTGQEASKPDLQENDVTVATKTKPKRRKPQRTSRVIYESTESSIFENIIAESQAAALEAKEATTRQEDAKVQQAGNNLASKGQEEDAIDPELIELMARRMRAKAEQSERAQGKRGEMSGGGPWLQG